jgi:tetratricopeptide (TPR) repeat protein
MKSQLYLFNSSKSNVLFSLTISAFCVKNYVIMPCAVRSVFARLLLCLFLLYGSMVQADPYDDLVKKGRDHFGLFQYKEARSCLEKAVAYDGTRYEGHYQLGRTLRKLNDNAGAIKCFEAALKAGTDELDCARELNLIYVQLAKEARSSGNRSLMLDYLGKACNVYPLNTQNWASLLGELYAERRFNDIILYGGKIKNANREALELGEDKFLQKSLIIVAKACKDTQDHGKAREFIKAASLIHNSDDELIRLKQDLGQQSTQVASNHLEEGRTLYEKGDYKKAVEKLKLAAGAEPGNSEIADLLSLSEKKMTIQDFLAAANQAEKSGDYPAALEKLERALSFAEQDQTLSDRLASVSNYIEKTEAKKAAEKRRRDEEARSKRLAGAAKIAKFKDLLAAAKKSEEKQAYDAAIQAYQEALKIDPDHSDLPADIERAKQMKIVYEEQQSRWSADLAAAAQAFDSGDHDKALGLYQKLGDTPGAEGEMILTRLIELSLLLEKDQLGETYAVKLAVLAPTNLLVPYFRGMIAFRKGEYEAAAEALNTVYSQDKSFRPDLRKTVWLLTLNKYKWHMASFGVLILIFTAGPILAALKRYNQGRIDGRIETLVQAGDYARAIPLMEKRIEDFSVSNRKALLVWLAEGYLKTGAYPEAKARAAEILTKDPKSSQAQRVLGEASFALKDSSPEGIERIQTLYKLDESRKDVLSFLVAYYKTLQSDSKTALDHLHKQLTMAPEDDSTLLYLAEFYSKRSTANTQALKVFERAVKADPDRPEFLSSFAQCLLQTGKKEEAAKMMNLGRERWPGHQLFRDVASAAGKAAAGASQTSDGRPASPEVGTTAMGAQSPSLGGVKPGVSPVSRLLSSSRLSAAKGAPGASPAETSTCAHCGEINPAREYYCTKCGKPLK